MAVVDASVTPADVAALARVLHSACGLVLDADKDYLVKSRLLPVATRHGFASIRLLIERLKSAAPRELLTEVVNAMVTTETSFFRDLHPFTTLQQRVLPELLERRRHVRRLNVWCAASSSGQEPYSLAMLLREYFPELESWQIHLWATDISQDMLQRCRTGRYSQIEVNRGLPTPLLLKWFQQEGAHWQLADSIRRTVQFSQLNLVETWPTMPAWDLICLRNVMIYFDNEAKRSILERVSRVLSTDGFLLLGGAETTFQLHDGFEPVETLRAGFYRLRSERPSELSPGRTPLP